MDMFKSNNLKFYKTTAFEKYVTNYFVCNCFEQIENYKFIDGLILINWYKSNFGNKTKYDKFFENSKESAQMDQRLTE